MSAKEEKIELEGEITESLRGSMFRITLDNGHEVLAHIFDRGNPEPRRTLSFDIAVSDAGTRMLRFCFAKDFDALEEACRRIRAFRSVTART